MSIGNILGPLNINPSMIDSIRSHLEEISKPFYDDLKKRPETDFKQDVDPWNYIGKGFITIPLAHFKSSNEEKRYFFRKMYQISKLDPESPLAIFSAIINNVVAQYGLKLDALDLRYERGYYEVVSPMWHFDGPFGGKAFTICWSTRKNWTTHYAEPSEIEKILPELGIHNYYLLSESYDRVKPFDRPAEADHLYFATNLLHRSPLKEDLGDEPLSSNDWRLLFRFAEEHF